MTRHIAIIDIGKTLAKVSIWSFNGVLLERETRPNKSLKTKDYLALDTDNVEAWLANTLRSFATQYNIGHIFPVGHGAACVVIRDGSIAAPPLDYEDIRFDAWRSDYEKLRDSFSHNGSPALPGGLNLGFQIYCLVRLYPQILAGGAHILPWPQYWAWKFSGVPTSEITSLGCHTDLWAPKKGTPSNMALQQGWAHCIAPLRRADEMIGRLTPDWAQRTGLAPDTQVYCGLHDSNAALIAARGFRDISDFESTVLSTGTWFISMRSPKDGTCIEIESMPENRDCLINIDVAGKLIPTARFMGGREIQTLITGQSSRIDIPKDQASILKAVPDVLCNRAMILPSFAPGVGPFQDQEGRWLSKPDDPFAHRAAVSLYAAMVANESLGLIGSQDRILIEGRFAAAQVFTRALAALRPQDRLYVSHIENDVSYGALRLINPSLPPIAELERIQPLPHDFSSYYKQWRAHISTLESAE